jgi:hypothetical protein
MSFINGLLPGHRKSYNGSESDIALVPQYNRENDHKKSQSISSFSQASPTPDIEYAPSYNFPASTERGRSSYQTIRHWPSAPVTLGNTATDIILHVLHDLFMILVPIPFFVLAGIVVRRDGRVVDDEVWVRINTATRIV